MRRESRTLRSQRRKRAATIFAPFLFLLLLLAFINWVIPQKETEESLALRETTPAPASPPGQGEAAPTDVQPPRVAQPTSTMEPSGTPIDTPTPTATPYVPPTFPADTRIELLGPPRESIFLAGDPVSLFWRWPFSLSPDQRFEVVILTNGQETELGDVGIANLGNAYTAQLPLANLASESTPLQWQVRLATSFSETPILASEQRTILVLNGP